jgi:hypothetical protein
MQSVNIPHVLTKQQLQGHIKYLEVLICGLLPLEARGSKGSWMH